MALPAVATVAAPVPWSPHQGGCGCGSLTTQGAACLPVVFLYSDASLDLQNLLHVPGTGILEGLIIKMDARKIQNTFVLIGSKKLLSWQQEASGGVFLSFFLFLSFALLFFLGGWGGGVSRRGCFALDLQCPARALSGFSSSSELQCQV